MIIYLIAYPKSGSTWLTNLLGDILNSSTYGSRVGDEDIVTQERPGPYAIHRGHFILVDNESGPVVPQPHQLAWNRITDEKLIFLIRDPRDICVSGAWHWQVSAADFLGRMTQGDVAGCGRWDEYVNNWYQRVTTVTYENLLNDTFLWLHRTLAWLNIHYTPGRMIKALNRQSFAVRKAQLGGSEAELRRHNMRLGVAGDWRNHFTPAMNERILNEFGWMMEKFGYDLSAY